MQKNDHLKTKKISALMIALSVAYLVVACGGGSSSEPTASPTPAPTPTPTPGATPTPAPSPSATPTPSPSATVCTPAAIGASGYSLVFKACNGVVAEYYDKTECVRDNATGLIWQGQDPAGAGSIRANYLTYTNFDSTAELQKEIYVNNTSTNTFVAPTQSEILASTNTVGFKNAVNGSNLCGSSAWRLPSRDELLGIVKASESPKITNEWFPNSTNTSYWTSSGMADPRYGPDIAWTVAFNWGWSMNFSRGFSMSVRLVR